MLWKFIVMSSQVGEWRRCCCFRLDTDFLFHFLIFYLLASFFLSVLFSRVMDGMEWSGAEQWMMIYNTAHHPSESLWSSFESLALECVCYFSHFTRVTVEESLSCPCVVLIWHPGTSDAMREREKIFIEAYGLGDPLFVTKTRGTLSLIF